MPIKEVDIVVKDDGSAEDLEYRINHILRGFPLELTNISHAGGFDWRCRFTAREGLDIGFRKVVEMQSLLAGELDIRLVERVSGPAVATV